MYHHVKQRGLLEIKQPSLLNSQYHNHLPSTAITQLPSHNHSMATLHTMTTTIHHGGPSRHGHRCAFVAQGWPGGGMASKTDL